MTPDENANMTEAVLKDLDMSQSDLEEGVKHLMHWMLKQPHLAHLHPGENMLKSFIIGSKSVERSKEKLDAYYNCKGIYEFTSVKNITHIKWDSVTYPLHLGGVTPKGWKVLFLEFPKGCSHFHHLSTCQLTSMEFDLLLRDHSMVRGHATIVDMAHLSVDIMKSISPLLLGQVLKLYQTANPIRIKGIYLINGSPLSQILINNFIKPFCSQKLKDKIVVCSNLEELGNYIPLEMMPKEYGGRAPSLDELKFEFIKKLKKEEEWFSTVGSERSDESKRPLPLKYQDELEGTFRRLNID